MQRKESAPLCTAMKLPDTDWTALDEAVIEEWILSGMVGKLVKRYGHPVRIQPCPPAQDGQWGVYQIGREA